MLDVNVRDGDLDDVESLSNPGNPFVSNCFETWATASYRVAAVASTVWGYGLQIFDGDATRTDGMFAFSSPSSL